MKKNLKSIVCAFIIGFCLIMLSACDSFLDVDYPINVNGLLLTYVSHDYNEDHSYTVITFTAENTTEEEFTFSVDAFQVIALSETFLLVSAGLFSEDMQESTVTTVAGQTVTFNFKITFIKQGNKAPGCNIKFNSDIIYSGYIMC